MYCLDSAFVIGKLDQSRQFAATLDVKAEY